MKNHEKLCKLYINIHQFIDSNLQLKLRLEDGLGPLGDGTTSEDGHWKQTHEVEM